MSDLEQLKIDAKDVWLLGGSYERTRALESDILELVAELEASRTAGDQLRAVITDLIIWARRGWTLKANVDQLEADAARLLDTIQSPPEREPAP
jgi:hypothetical protein